MDRSQIKKILIVTPNWIGDAVLSVPAIFRLREVFPDSKITIVGPPHISELFKECPYADEIMVYNDRRQKTEDRRQKMGLLTTVRDIQRCKFDLAILLPNSFRSALMVRLAGIPYRCGYNKGGRGALLNIPVKADQSVKSLHQTEYYLNLLKSVKSFFPDNTPINRNYTKDDENPPPPFDFAQGRLTPLPQGEEKSRGIAVFPPPSMGGGEGEGAFRLYISQEEKEDALNILTSNHVNPDDLIIGINPGAAYGSSKRWYPERFGHVARTLIKRYDAKVVVFGSKGEADISEEIVRNAEAPLLNMAGKTSIRELMALIGHCRLFITNDSGPMHIAAALGVPVVAIFGSTDPLITGPVGGRHVVIRKDVSCSPCFLRKCPTDLKCMDLVSVNDVLEGVADVIARQSS